MRGQIADVAGYVDGASAVAAREVRAEAVGVVIRRGRAGDAEIEALGRERLGDGETDAAPGAGHDSDGAIGHDGANLVEIRWSATRSACAAIVRAGLTAAELGMKAASTTNRFG